MRGFSDPISSEQRWRHLADHAWERVGHSDGDRTGSGASVCFGKCLCESWGERAALSGFRGVWLLEKGSSRENRRKLGYGPECSTEGSWRENPAGSGDPDQLLRRCELPVLLETQFCRRCVGHLCAEV